jgi:hypothetical protein
VWMRRKRHSLPTLVFALNYNGRPGAVVMSHALWYPLNRCSAKPSDVRRRFSEKASAEELSCKSVFPSDSWTTAYWISIVTRFVFGSVVWPSTVSTRSVSPASLEWRWQEYVRLIQAGEARSGTHELQRNVVPLMATDTLWPLRIQGDDFAVKDGLPFRSSLIARARPPKSSSIQRGWSDQQLERRSSCGATHRIVAR